MWENNKFFRSIAVMLSISIFLSFSLPAKGIAAEIESREKEEISEELLTSNGQKQRMDKVQQEY